MEQNLLTLEIKPTYTSYAFRITLYSEVNMTTANVLPFSEFIYGKSISTAVTSL
jgi:hypothetical protein